jgi:hypothetical protein
LDPGAHAEASEATMSHVTPNGSDFLMGPTEDETPAAPPARDANGYSKIADKHLPQLVAIPPVVADKTVISQNGSLLFNYQRPDGSRFTVERPDNPPRDPKTDKILFKYKHPPGGRGLNVHRLVRDLMADTGAPLIVAEGTKQYLAVVGACLGKRLFPVGMSGIRNWQWKPGGEHSPSVPLPDWGYIPIKGRKAYVVPDGDYKTNEDVQNATDDLMDHLRSMGASEVHRVDVPLVADSKTGVDDWLATVPQDARQAALLRLLDDAEDDSDEMFISRSALDEMPPIQHLIEGILNKASIVWLSGKFGTYKTFLALAWALCVATGRTWEGHRVHETGPVVYVAAEGHRGILRRIQAWETVFNGGRQAENLIVTPKGLNPTKPDDMAKLRRRVIATGAKVVFFDTLHRCAPGIEENSAKDQGAVMDGIQKLKDDTGCTVVMLAHTGYEGAHARGSSSQEDDADDAYVIKLAGDPEDRSPTNPRILKRRKSKEGESGEEFPLVLRTVDPFGGDSESGAYVTLMSSAFEAGEQARAQVRGRETNVQRIIRLLDEYQVPTDYGERRVRGWLEARELEITGKGVDFRTALAARRERAAMSGAAPEDQHRSDVPPAGME